MMVILTAKGRVSKSSSCQDICVLNKPLCHNANFEKYIKKKKKFI